MKGLGSSDGSTRRQLLGGLGLAATAAAIAPGRAVAKVPVDPRAADRKVLEGLLVPEQQLIYGCRRLLASGLLAHDSTHVVTLILGQEREHLAVLEEQIRALGGAPSARPFRPSADLVKLFTGLRREAYGLRALVDVESVAEGTYFQAIGQLHHPKLAQIAAEIMACEAQHWSLLADLNNHGLVYNIVTDPYVRGSTQLP